MDTNVSRMSVRFPSPRLLSAFAYRMDSSTVHSPFHIAFFRNDHGAPRSMHIYLSRIQLLFLVFMLFPAADFGQNKESTKFRQPLAIVQGQTIYYDDLLPAVKAQLLRLRSQEYEIKKKALDTLIEQKLLETAADKKGVTADGLIEQELSAKVPEPTEAELQAYYLGQKATRPFDEVKDQLRQGLKQARVQQARQQFLKGLPREDVLVLLSPPIVKVAYDPARLRGDAKEPVMIVEFSDFECPFCHKSEEILKDVLAKYKGKVSLAYRDLPLTQIHPQAEQAAEASRCAGEQGRFWEYHDELFRAFDLERSALVDYARVLKLDENRFTSCLDSSKYKAPVEQDLQEATQAGVSGTPAFFINGVPLIGAQSLDSFVGVIEEELARTRSPGHDVSKSD